MRWESGRQSENVEDRRGVHVSRGVVGGGIGTFCWCWWPCISGLIHPLL